VGHDLPVVEVEADQPLDGEQLRAQGIDGRPDPRQCFLLLGDLPGERVRPDRFPRGRRGQAGRSELRTGEPIRIRDPRMPRKSPVRLARPSAVAVVAAEESPRTIGGVPLVSTASCRLWS
jgi:hypothetical protein